MNAVSKILATVFGLGYFPIAPGTLTSLVFVIIYKAVLYKMGWPSYLVLLTVIFVVGAWASGVHESRTKTEDPRTVVIDEVLGQLVTLFYLNPDWIVLGLGFALFRALDILKPFVIKRAEEIPGGWGIMMDDLLAGLISSILLNLYLLLK